MFKNKTIRFFTAFVLVFLLLTCFWGQSTKVNAATELPDPKLPELPDPLNMKEGGVEGVITKVIKAVLGLVGVLALVMFIIGGLTWMTSGGSAERVKKGKDTVVWAVLGLALIFFSYAVINFVLNVLMKK